MSGEKRVIITKTPFRVHIAGGGDIADYYTKYGDGAFVSGALNRYMYITVSRYFFENSIRAHYALMENDVTNVDEINHPSIRECLKFTGITKGVQINSIADFPARGTGVGSSSSFAVGLLNALHSYKGEKVSPEQLAREAVYIEREVLREAGGKQDQYMAAYGGIKLLVFKKDGTVDVKDVEMKKKDIGELEKHLLLMYTGKERSSSSIHVNQGAEAGSHVDAYRKMVDLAYKLYAAYQDGRWMETGKILHENWELKKTLASGISDQYLNRLYKTAIENGAEGGELMGAGGGGFFMFFADPDKHERIIEALPEARAERFGFEMEGSKVIYEQGSL